MFGQEPFREIVQDGNALIFNLTSSGSDSGSNINESHWIIFGLLSPLLTGLIVHA